jgi:acyl-CoA dehydrogenase
MWDFETDADYQADLDWAEAFVREEVEPLRFVIPHAFDTKDPLRNEILKPLQAKVKARGLWATHLGPELGGKGHGQLKLALLNEILGRTAFAPMVFGCSAPDTGNAEILAHYGTPEHKAKYLQPLLDGDIVSCFSMTEPQAGSDPKEFTCKATLDGDDWVIEGEKWFSSNARYAAFFITMVVTDPQAEPYRQHSMLIVPSDAPGVTILRNVGIGGWAERLDPAGEHAHIRYDKVRVPKANMLGPQGGAFLVSQTRLGGGRIHHAMRTVGMARAALEMMKERAVSRRTQGETLSRKQMVQEMIADSWIELEQFRLLLLHTAWKIDKHQDYQKVRADISAAKVAMAKVLHDIAHRAIQIHGSFGLSDEAPFVHMLLNSYQLGLADGPTEVHKATLARELLKGVAPAKGVFPAYTRSTREAAAKARYAETLERHGRL